LWSPSAPKWGSLLPALSTCFELAPDRLAHRSQIASYRLPDDRRADAEVLVNEQVSKVAHVLPGHVGQSSGRLGIRVPRGLADDLQIPDDGIDRLPVSGEGLERVGGRVVEDSVDGFRDILQA